MAGVGMAHVRLPDLSGLKQCLAYTLPTSFMFCPKCKVEYRPGFIRCSDCEVDLVEELPMEGSPSDDALTLLWECADQTECVCVCRDLKNAELPYQVEQVPY